MIHLEIYDKRSRKISLTKKQWSHIKYHHPNVEEDEIRETISNPDKVIYDEREDIESFYRFFKHKNQKSKFLKIVVSFLNNEGFIITSYFMRTIK